MGKALPPDGGSVQFSVFSESQDITEPRAVFAISLGPACRAGLSLQGEA